MANWYKKAQNVIGAEQTRYTGEVLVDVSLTPQVFAEKEYDLAVDVVSKALLKAEEIAPSFSTDDPNVSVRFSLQGLQKKNELV